MKYNKLCECCGRKRSAYTYRLNKNILSALEKLIKRYEETKRRVKLRDLNLTLAQTSGIAHLQYWGLTYNEKKSILWYPTQLAIRFYNGWISLPDTAAYMEGYGVLPYDHEAWKTHKKPIKEVYVYEVDQIFSKHLKEFRTEKGSRQLQLFN